MLRCILVSTGINSSSLIYTDLHLGGKIFFCSFLYKPHHDILIFVCAKTKEEISCVATSQLISAIVFATYIAQSLYFLNPKFEASSHLLWLYSLVCVGPGWTGFYVGNFSFHFQNSRKFTEWSENSCFRNFYW